MVFKEKGISFYFKRSFSYRSNARFMRNILLININQ